MSGIWANLSIIVDCDMLVSENMIKKPSQSGRMIFAEVSKVRHYHSTVMNGFIEAWYEAEANKIWGNPYVFAHESFVKCLSKEVQDKSIIEYISVLDPDKRHLIRKTIIEFFVTMKIITSMRKEDVLLITTIFPTTMVLVEIFVKLFPKRNVTVLQHNELEDAFLEERPSLGTYGHANLMWHKVRQLGSHIKIAVLANFIAEGVKLRFHKSLKHNQLHVIPMPMKAITADEHPRGERLKCCFVGFDTKVKGFSFFEKLAEKNPDKDFVQIGGGVVRKLNSSLVTELKTPEAFIESLSSADVAIMPYTSGYEYSLSAAATDAISAGVHLLTFDRGCFRALRSIFGPESVTICTNDLEMHQYLTDQDWNIMVRNGKVERLVKVNQSEFGLGNVGKSLSRLIPIP